MLSGAEIDALIWQRIGPGGGAMDCGAIRTQQGLRRQQLQQQ